ncbi:hypothetical protein PGB90_007170 [Kerria lacca]
MKYDVAVVAVVAVVAATEAVGMEDRFRLMETRLRVSKYKEYMSNAMPYHGVVHQQRTSSPVFPLLSYRHENFIK